MKNILEDIKIFVVELIGLIGGFIWASKTNWDYEPIILLSISAIGIVIFVILKLIPAQEERPNVEMEFIRERGFRSPPTMIPNKSPMEETGKYFVIEDDGIYFFEIDIDYDFIIRNNSKNNAYNLRIYKSVNSYHLIFKTKQNTLEPLTIEKPKSIKLNYKVSNSMKRAQADEILNSKLMEDLKNITFIAEYQNENRKKYYTKFNPLNQNENLKKKPNLENYQQI